MGECMRRCERLEEVAEMEVGHGGVVRTRAIDVSSSDGCSKRRKIDSTEPLLSSSSSSGAQLVKPNHCFVNLQEDNSVYPATSAISDHVSLSPCSTDEYRESVKQCSPDLKPEGLKTEISMFASSGFREPSSSIEVYGDSSSEMESSSLTRKKPSPAVSGRKPAATVAAKMPSTAEIEEFFSVAENYERKRFADKYNYDVVKDVPLEGRYQWVRLKPC